MSYRPDLSQHLRNPKILQVGWLDKQHPFETARTAKWIVEKLWSLCEYSLAHAGGFHACNLPGCCGPFKNVKIHFGGGRPNAHRLQEEYMSLRKLFETFFLRLW